MSNLKDNLKDLQIFYKNHLKNNLSTKYGIYFFDILKDYTNEHFIENDCYLMNNDNYNNKVLKNKNLKNIIWKTLIDSILNVNKNQNNLPKIVYSYYLLKAKEAYKVFKRHIKGTSTRIQDYVDYVKFYNKYFSL